jgi:hypothetical protein
MNDAKASLPLPEVIKLRYAGRCGCGEPLTAGDRAGYVRAEKRLVCLSCMADLQSGRSDLAELAAGIPVPPLPGVAGGAARREYERRVAQRAARLAERNRLIRLAGSLAGEPQSTTAWARGAEGEEAVAALLASAASRGVLALHDRRLPGKRSNIDHIAIGPAGAYVIDAKKYAGARIRVRRVGGLFSPRRDELLVRGRVKNDLVDGVRKQVDVVREVLVSGGAPEVPVVGALCFLSADFPFFSGGMSSNGVRLVGPRGVVKLASTPGPLDEELRWELYTLMGNALRSMT